MEKIGLIKGYYTVLDISRLGYLNFRVFLKFYNVTPEKEDEIIDYLIKNPKVGWLVRVEGGWHTNMLVWAENVYEFREFWADFAKKYGNYIESKWISIITEMIQFRKAYLKDIKLDDSKVQVSGGTSEKADLDKKDWQILKLIAPNARESLLEIGKQLHISPKVVSYRIKKMIEKGVIQGFRVLLDLNLLGIEYYKVHFSLQNMTEQKEKEILEYARVNPNIIIVDITVGGADFEIEIHAKDNKHFHNILNDMKKRFASIIKDYETLHYYKEYKWVYLPV
jgi:Lrp/AsnC family leucine-responsive transcriptional regulator